MVSGGVFTTRAGDLTFPAAMTHRDLKMERGTHKVGRKEDKA